MFAYRMRALDGFGDMLLPIHAGESKESSYSKDSHYEKTNSIKTKEAELDDL